MTRSSRRSCPVAEARRSTRPSSDRRRRSIDRYDRPSLVTSRVRPALLRGSVGGVEQRHVAGEGAPTVDEGGGAKTPGPGRSRSHRGRRRWNWARTVVAGTWGEGKAESRRHGIVGVQQFAVGQVDVRRVLVGRGRRWPECAAVPGTGTVGRDRESDPPAEVTRSGRRPGAQAADPTQATWEHWPVGSSAAREREPRNWPTGPAGVQRRRA